jgi:hypothetical protein
MSRSGPSLADINSAFVEDIIQLRSLDLEKQIGLGTKEGIARQLN